MDVYKSIRALQAEGVTSQRAAARILGISRNTVKKYWMGDAVPLPQMAQVLAVTWLKYSLAFTLLIVFLYFQTALKNTCLPWIYFHTSCKNGKVRCFVRRLQTKRRGDRHHTGLHANLYLFGRRNGGYFKLSRCLNLPDDCRSAAMYAMSLSTSIKFHILRYSF